MESGVQRLRHYSVFSVSRKSKCRTEMRERSIPDQPSGTVLPYPTRYGRTVHGTAVHDYRRYMNRAQEFIIHKNSWTTQKGKN